MKLKSLTTFLNYSRSLRLYLLTALLATIVCEILLLIQPLFVRAFIDYFSANMAQQKLIWFPIFMLGVAILAYVFDLISVAIRFLLVKRIETEMKESYIELGENQSNPDFDFSIRAGIANLAKFTLNINLDLHLSIFRILLILGFIFLEYNKAGILSLIAVTVSILFATLTSLKIGRLSKTREAKIGEFLTNDRAKQKETKDDFIKNIRSVELLRFLQETKIFSIGFFCFQLLPFALLIYAALEKEISFGVLASLMLYFSLLRTPFLNFLEIFRNSMIFFADSEIFRDELERNLSISKILKQQALGILWSRDFLQRGEALSQILERKNYSGREFYDDLKPLKDCETRKEVNQRVCCLSKLRALSLEKSVILYSSDRSCWQFAHFMVNEELQVESIFQSIDSKHDLQNYKDGSICILKEHAEGKKFRLEEFSNFALVKEQG